MYSRNASEGQTAQGGGRRRGRRMRPRQCGNRPRNGPTMADRLSTAAFLVVLALHPQASEGAEEEEKEAGPVAGADLFGGLASDDPQEVEAAERRLARAGPEAAALLQRLKVRVDRFLRMDAALQKGDIDEALEAVRFFAERDGYSYVLKALGHPWDDVKLEAARRAVGGPKKEVAAALIQALEDNKRSREGSDVAMMRRGLQEGLVSAIGRVLGRDYPLVDAHMRSQMDELIRRMKKDLGDLKSPGPGEEATPGTGAGPPEETGSGEPSAGPAAQSLPVTRVSASRTSAQPGAANPSAERLPEKRTVEREPGNTPSVPGMWQKTQAPASSEGSGWTYLVVGLAAGVSVGAGATWLLLRGRSGG